MARLGKLKPMEGVGRLVGGRNGMEVMMNLLKTTLMGMMAWTYVQGQFTVIMSLGDMDFPANFAAASHIVYDLAWRLAWMLLVLAAADWIWQKWRHERDLRMSKQEVKDD